MQLSRRHVDGVSPNTIHRESATVAVARTRDRATCQAIENFDVRHISHADACGATPVGGLLIAAQGRGMQITTLKLQNSGDTAGGRQQVVGYGSWMLLN